MMQSTRLFSIVLVLAAVAAASACGRKSALDTPYQAQTEARQEAEKAGTEPLPPVPQPPETDRRFILDGLLD